MEQEEHPKRGHHRLPSLFSLQHGRCESQGPRAEERGDGCRLAPSPWAARDRWIHGCVKRNKPDEVARVVLGSELSHIGTQRHRLASAKIYYAVPFNDRKCKRKSRCFLTLPQLEQDGDVLGYNGFSITTRCLPALPHSAGSATALCAPMRHDSHLYSLPSLWHYTPCFSTPWTAFPKSFTAPTLLSSHPLLSSPSEDSFGYKWRYASDPLVINNHESAMSILADNLLLESCASKPILRTACLVCMYPAQQSSAKSTTSCIVPARSVALDANATLNQRT